jgi:chromatin segregation and condensation protein Rec8/ScpA/Scc1 (kleisin family)
MYRDDIWYRKLVQEIEAREDEFTDKQWSKYRIDQLLRVADRVRQKSEACETCRDFQHTITRLEEELQELPDSKAQRQWQAEKLREMGKHFVQAHDLAPPHYFLRQWLKIGLVAGLVLGLFAALFVTHSLISLPLGGILGGLLGGAYGWVQDSRMEQQHKLI